MLPPLRLLTAACLLSGVLAAGATEYYVAPGGADTNAGTLAKPWLTIQKAADTLKPGDTVYVRAGTYSRTTINVSGTAAGGPVTFTNYPGEVPVIDASTVTPPAGDTALFLLQNKSYVTIRGFELCNYKSTSVSLVPAGILLTGLCQQVQIRQCNIHDIWNTAGTTSNSGNAFGIAVYGKSTTPSSGIIIDGNEVHHLKTGASESVVLNGNVAAFQVTGNQVHDNNNIAIDFIGYEGTCPDTIQDQARDGICRGNLVYNITSEGNQAYASQDYSADGLYSDGGRDIVMEGNIVHHCDIGVELASEHAGKYTSGITLRNNFIYSNRQTGLFLGGYASTSTGGSSGCKITGNTFYNNDTLQWDSGEVQLRYRTSGCDFQHNIFSAGPGYFLITVPNATATDGNNVNNTFNYNLYYTVAGKTPKWIWNKTTRTTFATWQTSSAQDAGAKFADPLFVSLGTTVDLHLTIPSPAVDLANSAYTVAATETDIDGQLRLTGSRVEAGADELAPVDAWRKLYFAQNATNPTYAALSANPAKDGVINLIKYALTLNPNLPVTSGLPQVGAQTVNGETYLTLQFTRSRLAVDTLATVQVSGNFTAWNDGPRYGAGGDLSANGYATELSRTISGNQETILVRDNIPTSAASKRFIRLQVTAP